MAKKSRNETREIDEQLRKEAEAERKRRRRTVVYLIIGRSDCRCYFGSRNL